MARKHYDAAEPMVAVRADTFEHVADEVSKVLRRAALGPQSTARYRRKRAHDDVPGKPCMTGRYAGQAEISRRLGRDMRRTLWTLQQGNSDTSVSTLADVAYATNHRLRISFEPVNEL